MNFYSDRLSDSWWKMRQSNQYTVISTGLVDSSYTISSNQTSISILNIELSQCGMRQVKDVEFLRRLFRLAFGHFVLELWYNIDDIVWYNVDFWFDDCLALLHSWFTAWKTPQCLGTLGHRTDSENCFWLTYCHLQ